MRKFTGLLCVLVMVSSYVFAGESISLSGEWRFAIDRQDSGLSGAWYSTKLPDSISLPGCLQSQGYGDKIGTHTPWVLSLYDRDWFLRDGFSGEVEREARGEDVRVPFLSQPPMHYLGAAWYQRDIAIPESWQATSITLTLERTRWKTTAWLDDTPLGSQDSLCAPHRYQLPALTKPGKHVLTVCVDNRNQMDYRPDAHSVSDSLGSTWNGIVGKIELESRPAVWLENVELYPDCQTGEVRVDVLIKTLGKSAGEGFLEAAGEKCAVSWHGGAGKASFVCMPRENPTLWSEFTPVLYELEVSLSAAGTTDTKTIRYGYRDISTDDYHLLVNGRRSHFRGTHSGGDFPLTGYPATDKQYWLDLFKTNQKWGLNHMRFHSFCPPEAAFEAADELGFYLQPEPGMWNVISPGTEMEKRLYEETELMLREYGNHPSFALFSPSNEPKGHWKEALTAWVENGRKRDNRRLYTVGTGWPLIEEPGHVEGADFLAVHRVGRRPVRGNSAWFGRNYLYSVRGVDVPIIVHELGQWCAYPDFDVMDKFTGYLRPGNYALMKESMEKAGLLALDKQFAYASGKLQAACYKEEVEANLRTPGLAGFQLLDLHDYLGQGTALVGVLDAFWEDKGYITSDEWSRFCSQTVPLAVLKSYIYTTADDFNVELQVANYAPAPFTAPVYWRLEDAGGNAVLEGELPEREIGLGSALPLGWINESLASLKAPAAYKLVVGLGGVQAENDWDIWLYPEPRPRSDISNVLITEDFDQAAAVAAEGENVLLIPAANQLAWDCPPIGRDPIFWNRLMGPAWERFLGLTCENEHPALAGFPTESWYDWQWRDVFGSRSRAMNISAMPESLKPIVRMIDDWNRNYPLAAMFECSLGKGKLVVCSADIGGDLSRRPAAAAMRESIISYMRSQEFAPETTLTKDELFSIRQDTSIMRRLRADAPQSAIDGNPNSYWTSPLRNYPHRLNIVFPGVVEISGLRVINRQDQREHQGDIREYEVLINEDGESWTVAAKGELASTFNPQVIDFGRTVSAKCIRFNAISGFGADRTASIADIAVIYEGRPIEQLVESEAYVKTASATA
ncbi:MAG: discoidin domain-containing protein, partial [Phycisphaerae bacterium]